MAGTELVAVFVGPSLLVLVLVLALVLWCFAWDLMGTRCYCWNQGRNPTKKGATEFGRSIWILDAGQLGPSPTMPSYDEQ